MLFYTSLSICNNYNMIPGFQLVSLWYVILWRQCPLGWIENVCMHLRFYLPVDLLWAVNFSEQPGGLSILIQQVGFIFRSVWRKIYYSTFYMVITQGIGLAPTAYYVKYYILEVEFSHPALRWMSKHRGAFDCKNVTHNLDLKNKRRLSGHGGYACRFKVKANIRWQMNELLIII